MKKYYERKDLDPLTIYRLKEIAREECLVKSAIYDLDREDLIDLILSYRSAGLPEEIKALSNEDEETLSELFGTVKRTYPKNVEVPSKLILYDGIDMTFADGCEILCKDISPGFVFVVSEETEFCAALVLKRDFRGKFFITRNGNLNAKASDKRAYSLLCFDEDSSELINDALSGKKIASPLRALSFPLLDFAIFPPIETDAPLAVDFGTSGTTMGIFLDFELAKKMETALALRKEFVRDAVNPVMLARDDGESSPILPTAIAALDISGDIPKYEFGEKALALSSSVYAQSGMSVFLNIKRWISVADKDEEVTDKEGFRQSVSRKELLRAFLLHAIHTAEQYYKCRFTYLHFSAPVKERHRFHTLFSEILDEYELLPSLDEGASVLYGTIAEMIEKRSFEKGRTYKALIADCGGGTTDLSSCAYTIENRREGYHVSMETVHENGDVNFGGNSLTYRIFKYLKVLAAENLSPSDRGAARISFPGDAYRFTDEHGESAYYEELEHRYAEAEKIIPTRFKEYEKESREVYLQVRNNFYDLFRFAEKVKERFFETDGVLALALISKDEYEREKRFGFKRDNTATVFPVQRLLLSAREKDGTLKKRKAWPSVTITVREMERLLAADIYAIMKKFLEKPFSENELRSLDVIKLTGQSCKIGLFRDVLKEFVPGVLLSFGSIGKGKDPHALKLVCLYGALKYLNARRSGTVKVEIKKKQPFLPYFLSAYTHEGSETILVNCLDEKKLSGNVSRHLLELALPIHLKDSDGNAKHDFVYHCAPGEFTPALHEEIASKYHFVPQGETDDIVRGEVKFFVSAMPDEWGFIVAPVARGEEGLLLGREEFFAFEDSDWETDYFDGLK
jgi:hypothetical protein